MRRTEHKNNGIKTIVERYSSFKEFAQTCNNREVVWTEGSNSGIARERKGDDWTRCNSFEEAQGFLLNGFNESVPEMIQKVKGLTNGSRVKTKRYSDVVGYAPIVPNALLGLPNSMMNSKKVKVKSKVITIVYDPSCSCNVSSQRVLDYGCKFINFVNTLEQQGMRVRVDYMFCDSDPANKRQYILRVPLKSEHNPLNIKRMSFALTNVGMLRYLGLDWVQRVPDSKRIRAYGTPIYGAPEEYKDNMRLALDDSEYFVHFEMDLDKVFEGR